MDALAELMRRLRLACPKECRMHREKDREGYRATVHIECDYECTECYLGCSSKDSVFISRLNLTTLLRCHDDSYHSITLEVCDCECLKIWSRGKLCSRGH